MQRLPISRAQRPKASERREALHLRVSDEDDVVLNARRHRSGEKANLGVIGDVLH